jgi:Helix-turn-helix domain
LRPRHQAARKTPSQPTASWSSARKPGEPFNPYGLFNGIFIPEAICKYRGLSLGAKMIYGRLCRYAGRNGAVYPAIPTLASELGIGKTQARTYVQELERKDFIAVDRENRHFSPNGSGGSNRYIFLWHVAFDGQEGQLRKTPPVRKTGGVPVRKTEPLPLRKTGTEENHHQESQGKESQLTKKLLSATTTVVRGEAKSRIPPKLLSVDDDEKSLSVDVEKLPCSPPYRSAWEELCAKFRAANQGAEMGFQDECWLKGEMERRGITSEELAKLVKENPLNGFRSPMAGLKWLVKKFRAKTCSSLELETETIAALGILPPPKESPRCEPCGNTGRVLERIEGQRPRVTDQYCDCRSGKELKTIETRKAAPAVPADAHPITS